MINTVAVSEILKKKDRKTVRRFYKEWSKLVTAEIKKYIKDHPVMSFGAKYNPRLMPFRIMPSSRSDGSIFFYGFSPNASLAFKGATDKRAKFKAPPPHVNLGGFWKTLKTHSKRFYPTNINLIDFEESDITSQDDIKYIYASKTSHGKTRKYPRPMLFAKLRNKDINIFYSGSEKRFIRTKTKQDTMFLHLRESLSDWVFDKIEGGEGMNEIIEAAFIKSAEKIGLNLGELL